MLAAFLFSKFQCLTLTRNHGKEVLYENTDSGSSTEAADRQGSTISGSLLSASSLRAVDLFCKTRLVMSCRL